MSTQFITNSKGEKTAAIVPIAEYEDLLHQHHINLELTDEYKSMTDTMLAQGKNGGAKYTLSANVKARFKAK